MLVTGFRITGPHLKRKFFRILYSQAVQDNMNMDISRFIVTLVVGTYQCLMARKMLLSKLHAQALCRFHCQSQLPVFRIETQNVMVGLDLSFLLIFPELLIGLAALPRKGRGIAQDTFHQEFLPEHGITVFIQEHLSGIFIMLKSQVALCFGIIRIFTGNVFQNRHQSSPASSSIFCFSMERSAMQ